MGSAPTKLANEHAPASWPNVPRSPYGSISTQVVHDTVEIVSDDDNGLTSSDKSPALQPSLSFRTSQFESIDEHFHRPGSSVMNEAKQQIVKSILKTSISKSRPHTTEKDDGSDSEGPGLHRSVTFSNKHYIRTIREAGEVVPFKQAKESLLDMLIKKQQQHDPNSSKPQTRFASPLQDPRSLTNTPESGDAFGFLPPPLPRRSISSEKPVIGRKRVEIVEEAEDFPSPSSPHSPQRKVVSSPPGRGGGKALLTTGRTSTQFLARRTAHSLKPLLDSSSHKTDGTWSVESDEEEDLTSEGASSNLRPEDKMKMAKSKLKARIVRAKERHEKQLRKTSQDGDDRFEVVPSPRGQQQHRSIRRRKQSGHHLTVPVGASANNKKKQFHGPDRVSKIVMSPFLDESNQNENDSIMFPDPPIGESGGSGGDSGSPSPVRSRRDRISTPTTLPPKIVGGGGGVAGSGESENDELSYGEEYESPGARTSSPEPGAGVLSPREGDRKRRHRQRVQIATPQSPDEGLPPPLPRKEIETLSPLGSPIAHQRRWSLSGPPDEDRSSVRDSDSNRVSGVSRPPRQAEVDDTVDDEPHDPDGEYGRDGDQTPSTDTESVFGGEYERTPSRGSEGSFGSDGEDEEDIQTVTTLRPPSTANRVINNLRTSIIAAKNLHSKIGGMFKSNADRANITYFKKEHKHIYERCFNGSIKEQRKIAELFQIAVLNPKLCKFIVSSGGLEAVLSLLRSSDPKTRVQAGQAVGHIALLGDDVRLKVAASDAFGCLLEMAESNDSEMKRHGLYAISNLAVSDGVATRILQKYDLLPAMIRLLKKKVPIIQSSAARIIAMFCRNDTNRKIVAESGVIQEMWRLLKTGTTDVHMECCRALSILSENSEYAAVVAQVVTIRALSDVLAGSDINAQSLAARTISAIVAQPKYKQEVYKYAMHRLLNLVSFGSKECQLEALRALTNLCYQDDMILPEMIEQQTSEEDHFRLDLSSQLKHICSRLRERSEFDPFIHCSKPEKQPDYVAVLGYEAFSAPMDLQEIFDRVERGYYSNLNSFREDVMVIVNTVKTLRVLTDPTDLKGKVKILEEFVEKEIVTFERANPELVSVIAEYKTKLEKRELLKSIRASVLELGGTYLISIAMYPYDLIKWQALQCLASLSVNDTNQQFLGDFPDLVSLVSCLKSEHLGIQAESARLFGNMANYSPNRKKLMDDGAVHLLVTRCSSDDPVVQRYAARALAVFADDDDIKLLLGTLGAVERLVSLVYFGGKEVKIEAIKALASLSEREKNKEKLMSRGGLGPLIIALNATETELHPHAARAIANIAQYKDSYRYKIMNEPGAIHRLIDMVRSFVSHHPKHVLTSCRFCEESFESLRFCLLALVNLAELDAIKDLLAELGIFQTLAQLIRDTPDVWSKRYAMALASSLASSKDSCRESLEKFGVTKLANDLLVDEDSELQFLAAGLLANLAQFVPLREVIAHMSLETLCVKTLHMTENPSAEAEACRCLAILAENDQVRDNIIDMGGLERCVQLMTSENESLQCHSTMLAKVISMTDMYRVQLAVSDVMPNLVELAKSENVLVAREAAAAISNLCINDDIKVLAVDCGCLPPLVPLISSTDHETRKNAVEAMGRLALNDQNRMIIADEQAIRPLVQCLQTQDDTLIQLALEALANLANHNASNQYEEFQEGALQTLLKLTKHENPNISEIAFDTIGSLTENEIIVHHLTDRKEFEAIISLANAPSETCRRNASTLFAHIFEHSQSGFSEFVGQGGVPSLVELLGDADLLVRSNAMFCLTSLAKRKEFHPQIVEAGGIQSVLNLISQHEDHRPGSSGILRTALRFLSDFALSETYFSALHEAGYLQELITLVSSTKSVEIKAEVLHVLANMASKEAERKHLATTGEVVINDCLRILDAETQTLRSELGLPPDDEIKESSEMDHKVIFGKKVTIARVRARNLLEMAREKMQQRLGGDKEQQQEFIAGELADQNEDEEEVEREETEEKPDIKATVKGVIQSQRHLRSWLAWEALRFVGNMIRTVEIAKHLPLQLYQPPPNRDGHSRTPQNLIFYAVNLTRSNLSSLQFEAASFLSNIAANEDLRAEIIKARGVPAMLSLLEVSQAAVCQQALRSLAHLLDIPEVRMQVLSNDGYKPILALANLHDVQIAVEAMYALATASKSSTVRDHLVREGVLPLLVRSLRIKSAVVQRCSLRVLATIAISSDLQDMIVGMHTLGAIVSFCSMNDPEIQLQAVKILAYVATEESNRQELVAAGGLHQILQFLISKHVEVQTDAARAVYHLCHMPECEETIIVERHTELICRAACSPDTMAHYWAAKTVMFLASSQSRKKLLFEAGGAPLVVRCLSSPFEDVRHFTAAFIRDVAQSDVGKQTLFAFGVIGPLLQLTKEEHIENVRQALEDFVFLSASDSFADAMAAHPTIERLVEMLGSLASHKEDEEKSLQDAIRILQVLAVCSDHDVCRPPLISSGAIHILMDRLLLTGPPIVPRCVMWILHNLVDFQETLQYFLENEKYLIYTLECLLIDDSETRSFASSLIAFFSLDDSMKLAIYKANGAPMLTQALQFRNALTIAFAAGALANLAENTELGFKLAQPALMCLLVGCLSVTNIEVQRNVSRALANLLVVVEKPNEEPVISCGIVEALVGVMNTGDMIAFSESCRALGNLTTIAPHTCPEIAQRGGVEMIVSALTSLGDAQEIANVGYLLANLTQHEEIIPRVIQVGGVEILLWLASHVTESNTLRLVYKTLAHLAAEEVEIEHIFRAGGALTFVGAIVSKPKDVAACAAEVLARMSAREICAEQIHEGQALPQLLTACAIDSPSLLVEILKSIANLMEYRPLRKDFFEESGLILMLRLFQTRNSHLAHFEILRILRVASSDESDLPSFAKTSMIPFLVKFLHSQHENVALEAARVLANITRHHTFAMQLVEFNAFDQLIETLRTSDEEIQRQLALIAMNIAKDDVVDVQFVRRGGSRWLDAVRNVVKGEMKLLFENAMATLSQKDDTIPMLCEVGPDSDGTAGTPYTFYVIAKNKFEFKKSKGGDKMRVVVNCVEDLSDQEAAISAKPKTHFLDGITRHSVVFEEFEKHKQQKRSKFLELVAAAHQEKLEAEQEESKKEILRSLPHVIPKKLDARIFDHEDGKYSVQFIPPVSGRYIATVFMVFENGSEEEMGRGPLLIHVGPGSESPVQTILEGPGLSEATAGIPQDFIIHAKDRCKNHVARGGAPFTAVLRLEYVYKRLVSIHDTRWDKLRAKSPQLSSSSSGQQQQQQDMDFGNGDHSLPDIFKVDKTTRSLSSTLGSGGGGRLSSGQQRCSPTPTMSSLSDHRISPTPISKQTRTTAKSAEDSSFELSKLNKNKIPRQATPLSSILGTGSQDGEWSSGDSEDFEDIPVETGGASSLTPNNTRRSKKGVKIRAMSFDSTTSSSLSKRLNAFEISKRALFANSELISNVGIGQLFLKGVSKDTSQWIPNMPKAHSASGKISPRLTLKQMKIKSLPSIKRLSVEPWTGDETLVPCTIADFQNGIYKCIYTIFRAGIYSLHVYLGDEEVNESPFKVTAVPGSAFGPTSIFEFPYLDDPHILVAGQDAKSLLFTCDELGNECIFGDKSATVHLVHERTGELIAPDPIDLKDGTYEIPLVPRTVGPYSVFAYVGEDLLAGCPFRIVVRECLPYVPSFTAEGSGLQKARYGRSSEFVIQVRDRWGNIVNKPIRYPLVAEIYAVQNKQLLCVANIEDLGNGQYKASYRLDKLGKYKIEISCMDLAISGSPFFVECTK